MEQERDLFEERMDALSEDLRHAHDTASIARRDLSAKIAQLEGDLSHKNETIRILEGREEALIADKDSLQGENFLCRNIYSYFRHVSNKQLCVLALLGYIREDSPSYFSILLIYILFGPSMTFHPK